MIEESHVVSLDSRTDVLSQTVGTLRYIPTERSVDVLLVLLTFL
jgi:hypothetical protein